MTFFTEKAESSSPGEFHPQALTEPYVSLSTHTALPMQTVFRLLPLPFVGRSMSTSDPSLYSHYKHFVTTTIWSAPVGCIGTQ